MNSKVCSAHQPAFLPWLGTIHKVAISDVFVVMDAAQFRKRDFMHRNRIEVNGSPHYVGLKVHASAESRPCNEVSISAHHPTCLLEIATKLTHTYGRYPFFADLRDFAAETLLQCQYSDLTRIYLTQLRFICEKLQIQTAIVLESELLTQDELRSLSVSERLLHHALRTHSDVYVTGVHSVDYLDTSVFDGVSVTHRVQRFSYAPFAEYQKCDVPLSIVHQIASMGYTRLRETLLTLEC